MFLHTKNGLLRMLKVSICPSSTGLSFQHVYTHTGTSSYMHFVWKLQLDLLHVYIILSDMLGINIRDHCMNRFDIH